MYDRLTSDADGCPECPAAGRCGGQRHAGADHHRMLAKGQSGQNSEILLTAPSS